MGKNFKSHGMAEKEKHQKDGQAVGGGKERRVNTPLIKNRMQKERLAKTAFT